MKHLLVMVFLCLIILMYCYGGAAKKASTFSTCPIRWSNSFKGPPGFPGKPGKEKINFKEVCVYGSMSSV